MRVIVAHHPGATLSRPFNGTGRNADQRRQSRQQRWWAGPPVHPSAAQPSGSSCCRAAASSDSLSDEGPAPSSTDSAEWQALVEGAQREVRQQQAAGLSPPYPLDKTRQLVETAMLAAVTALAYTIGNLLKVESYLAYILPLPVVLSALRSGPLPALKTLTTAYLLLLILTGPVRATTYLLVYGLLSLALGASWAWGLPWAASILLGALARIGGYGAYIALSSWVTNENLLMLMLTNIYSLLDQLSAFLGTTGSPPLLAVAITLASLLFVNSVFYVALMHVLYAVMLRAMGVGMSRMPRFVERLVAGLPA